MKDMVTKKELHQPSFFCAHSLLRVFGMMGRSHVTLLYGFIRHSLFLGLVLSSLFTVAGCGTPLGSDAEVLEHNARLASKVKVALVQESGLNAAPIDIQVRDGVVTLGGFVEREAQRKSAEQAAGEVEGVNSVINNIQVK